MTGGFSIESTSNDLLRDNDGSTGADGIRDDRGDLGPETSLLSLAVGTDGVKGNDTCLPTLGYCGLFSGGRRDDSEAGECWPMYA